MTSHFANRISFFAPNGFAERPNASFQTRHPTILVGIQRDACPPMAFGDTQLQRMRIIVVAPEEAAGFEGADALDSGENSLAEVLPMLPPFRGPARDPQARPRLVLGEILRGADGALYERFGSRIRPLRGLVAGPNGDVLEITDTGGARPRLLARVAAPSALEDEPDPQEKTDRLQSQNEPAASQTNSNQGSANRNGSQSAPAYRPLLPEPGQWRVVRLGDFKAMLVPQLAHPERLRDSHRLPCYVQVFEISAPQRVETLAEAIFGDASAVSELQPLDPVIVQQLQLAPLLPAPSPQPRPGVRQPGLLLPHERVFCLELATDPTDDTQAEETTGAPNQSLPSHCIREAEAPMDKSVIGSRLSGKDQSLPASAAPGETAARLSACSRVKAREAGVGSPASTGSAQPPGQGVPTLKSGVPAHFLKPWEFRLSREEALYDLSRMAGVSGTLGAMLRRVLGGWSFRRECRKWQVLLAGKNLDEQLWGVRPPHRGWEHRFIREWARRALELGGYDSRIMLSEWELFWRRKAG